MVLARCCCCCWFLFFFIFFVFLIHFIFIRWVRSVHTIAMYILYTARTSPNLLQFYCIFVVIIVAELIARWICVLFFLRQPHRLLLANTSATVRLSHGYKWSRSRSYMPCRECSVRRRVYLYLFGELNDNHFLRRRFLFIICVYLLSLLLFDSLRLSVFARLVHCCTAVATL